MPLNYLLTSNNVKYEIFALSSIRDDNSAVPSPFAPLLP